MLPNDPKKRETIKSYLAEAVKYEREKELANTRLKRVFASVKDSEDTLGYPLAEFKLLLKAAIESTKLLEDIESKSVALEDLSVLVKGETPSEEDDE